MNVLLISLEVANMRQTQLCIDALYALGISVACPTHSPLAERLTSKQIPYFPLPSSQGRNLALVWALKKVVQKHAFQVVHTLDAQAALGLALALPLIKSGQAKPYYIHSWDNGPNLSLLRAWRYKRSSLIAFSNALQAQLMSKMPNFNKQSCVLLPCVSLQANWKAIKKQGTVSQGRFVFLNAGPLEEEKNLHCLLHAMAYLHNMGMDLPPWEMRILGSGSLFKPLLEEADRLGIANCLALLGEQDFEQQAKLADAFVVSSASGSGDVENILEAWKNGVPVVCSQMDINDEIINDKKNALKVQNNPVALAGAMLRVLQEDKLRQNLRDTAWQDIADYSCAALAKKQLQIYRTAIEFMGTMTQSQNEKTSHTLPLDSIAIAQKMQNEEAEAPGTDPMMEETATDFLPETQEEAPANTQQEAPVTLLLKNPPKSLHEVSIETMFEVFAEPPAQINSGYAVEAVRDKTA